ncbi:MAG: peptidyl-prolyl cis-trans isomerase [Marinibacterium sp.]
MAGKGNKVSKTFVWILMGLLVIGLAGFGATNFTGGLTAVGKVAGQDITVNAFAREVQAEMRATQAQIGQPVTIEMARGLGLDQRAMARLVTIAALNAETADMGLSVGDETLRDEIVQINAFQGPDGTFDRESYRFALDRIGMSENEFESDLRAESARTLLQNAILSGVSMPAQMVDAMVQHAAERRSFTWALLQESDLATPLPEPTEADLRAYYDAHGDAFRLPETKVITYAYLTPDMILDTVQVEDDALQALYDQRTDRYNVPERRLVERLAFVDEAAAAAAKARLDAGEITFEDLVTERGLSLSDIDLGDVALGDLDGAGNAVFAANFGDVVGPLPSPLGPALFRVNGVVAARFTSFEDALPELRDELAADRARRVIETQAEDYNDRLAGGATVEELADETDMKLGTIRWFDGMSDGIAAYEAFRTAAASLTQDDFPEILFLEDGGVVAMRLDEVLPERPEPFADARPDVVEAWTKAELEAALTRQAEDLVARLQSGADFADLGLRERKETGLTRSDAVAGAPPTLVSRVFDMDLNTIDTVPGDGDVAIVRLDAILPPEEGGRTGQLRQALDRQLDQSLSSSLYQIFATDVQNRARPTIDQRAVEAVMSGFQ